MELGSSGAGARRACVRTDAEVAEGVYGHVGERGGARVLVVCGLELLRFGHGPQRAEPPRLEHGLRGEEARDEPRVRGERVVVLSRAVSTRTRAHADRGEEGERRTASAMSFMLGLISIPAVWARTLTRKEAMARGRACVSVRRLMVVRARGVFCVHRAGPAGLYKYTNCTEAGCEVL